MPMRICRTHLTAWEDTELPGCWYVDRHGRRCGNLGRTGSIHVVGGVHVPAPPSDTPTRAQPAGQE